MASAEKHMSGLGDWLLAQLPMEWLSVEMQRRLSTPLPVDRQYLGLADDPPPGIPECLAEEANLDAADAAYQVALQSLQFAVMELIRCQSQGIMVGMSSDQEQSISLIKSLSADVVRKTKTKHWKRQSKK